MTPKEAIFVRKSSRSFDMAPLDESVLEDIRAFGNTLRPLDEKIKTRFESIGSDSVKYFPPRKMPHYIAIFSEEKEGYLTNVGFMFQQLELYIQSLGIGCCWLGMGKYDPDDGVEAASKLPFVIMISFGRAKGSPHRKLSEFNRKPLAAISDTADERLEPARLAPSGVNSQPWYFLREGDCYHALCVLHGTIRERMLGKVNKIDMGCALANLYVANSETFEFFTSTAPKTKKGYYYIGSFKI